MRELLLTLSFILGFTTAAQAVFVQNRDSWSQITQFEKENYIIGVYDAALFPSNGDSGNERRWKQKIQNCMWEIKATSKTLADMVDNYYLNVANWSHPPIQALYNSTTELCDNR